MDVCLAAGLPERAGAAGNAAESRAGEPFARLSPEQQRLGRRPECLQGGDRGIPEGACPRADRLHLSADCAALLPVSGAQARHAPGRHDGQRQERDRRADDQLLRRIHPRYAARTVGRYGQHS